MSVDLAQRSAIFDLKHDIAQTVLSRKRKLCELYAVATAAEPVPECPQPNHRFLADAPATGPDHDAALALFLDHNDLDKGRYFLDSTLPPRINSFQPSLKIRKPQKSPGPQAASSVDSVTRNPVENGSLAPDAVNRATNVANLSKAPNALGDGSKSANDLPQSDSHTVSQARKLVNGTTPSTDSPRPTSGQNDGTAHAGSPRPTTQSEPSIQRLPEKPARPESPPYSPGTEPTTGLSQLDDSSARQDQEASANVLTPRKEAHDEVPFDKDNAEESLTNRHSSQPHVETQQILTEDKPRLDVVVAESESTPSSTAGRNSANTSGAEAHSSDTSQDNDGANSEQTGAPSLPSQQSSSVPDAPVSKAEPLGVTHGSSTSTATAKEKSSELPTSRDSQAPNLARSQSNHADADNKSTGSESTLHPAVIPDDLKAKPFAGHQEPQASSLKAKSPNGGSKLAIDVIDSADPMDIDHAEPTSDRIGHRKAPCDSKPSASFRVAKRQRKMVTVMPNQSTAKRALREARRLKDKTWPSQKRDYLKTLFNREAMTAISKSDIHGLLATRTKALSSADWMLYHSEETAKSALHRAEHLQNTNRWSLKQLPPCPQPASKPCQWDYLLEDVKWLRTDFREERKLKISVAKILAFWCAEWVNSDPNERHALRVKTRHSSSGAHTAKAEVQTIVTAESLRRLDITQSQDDLSDDDLTIFSTAKASSCLGNKLRISENVLQKIPQYSVASHLSKDIQQRGTVSGQSSDEKSTVVERAGETSKSGEGSASTDNEPPPELSPKDTSCALFAPEGKAMRKKLNAPWIFKPPPLAMPPQGFYENRPASQWTLEDDQQLRQSVKDYGSNWLLISANLTPKTEFTPATDRRTPWECFERLWATEGPPEDPQTRQYLKHFYFRLDKAKLNFEEQQSNYRQQAAQHARELGQNVPNVPQKRFPAPMRVERKPNKRFLAMLDTSRKLARRRETNLNKQEKLQQADAQAQRPPAARETPRPPQYYSRMKHEREMKEMDRIHQLNEQRRALIEAQRRQAAGYQAHLTNGIGQQMRNGVANGQTATNSHLAVPLQNQVRPQSQHPGMQMTMANGIPANSQVQVNGQAQVNAQNQQQRLISQMNGGTPMNQENMTRLMQQAAAQQRFQQAQNQQQQQQSQQQQSLQQFSHSSPNMATALPNPSNVMAGFNNSNNQFAATADNAQSPSSVSQSQNLASTQPSPHFTQALAHVAGNSQLANNNGVNSQGAPQPLSSGHVPQLMALQHSIQRQFPQLTPQEARRQATEQLKSFMRQNAMNSASGLAAQNVAQAMQNQAGGGGGSGSPYANQAQLHGAFQQNGMLASNGHLPQNQGRSVSPNGNPTIVTPQQQLYQAQLRQHMLNQRQQMGQMGIPPGSSGGAAASPNSLHALPNMGMANMAAMGLPQGFNVPNHRTPTPGSAQGMRPPSRSASAMDMQGFGIPGDQSQPGQGQQQRPGSAAGVARSPTRPLSSQDFGGQA